MVSFTKITVKTTRQTLSNLVFRFYGRRNPEDFERVLAANPNIGRTLFLSFGSIVKMPPKTENAKAPAEQEVIRLWS